MAARNEGSVSRGFLPGLVLGLVVGAFAGAVLPSLLTAQRVPTPDALPQQNGASERREFPPGESAEPEPAASESEQDGAESGKETPPAPGEGDGED